MAVTDKLGSRIGPRIAAMVAATMTDHKRQSQDIDANVQHAASWKTLTALGAEFSGLTRALFKPVLDIKDQMPQEMAAALDMAASGRYQGSALGMGTAVGIALGPFSALFDNFFAPLVYRAVGANPQLIPTLDALLKMAQQGIISAADLVKFAGWLGYDQNWTGQLTEATFNWPGLSTYFELKNRQLLSGDEQTKLLARMGYPSWLAPQIDTLSNALLSAPDAALAVLRGNMPLADGYHRAALFGLAHEDFDILIGNTGEPPGLAELLLLWRRGQITTDRLDQGIRQSRVRDEWIEDVHKLSIIPPSQAEAVDAVVTSQIDDATGRTRFAEAGGDPAWYETAVGITGAAPSPVELGTLANRGIIPWEGIGREVVSFEQGVFEGHSKNKYLPAWKALSVYLPPPRTITALIKAGALSSTQALELLQKQGLSPELAAAYVTGATADKLATHKQLSVATIESLYQERGIDRETAAAMLGAEGYDPGEVDYILWLSDFQAYKKAFDAALAKVQSSYVGHKIDHNTASTSLDALLVPAAQRDTLLTIWTFAKEANVTVLTAVQVRSAFKKQLIEQPEALQRLSEHGYSDVDANIFLQL